MNVAKNARLSDICISTSAAPTYLPAHYFETKEANGKTRSFNLIDGGVAANNPVSSLLDKNRDHFGCLMIGICKLTCWWKDNKGQILLTPQTLVAMSHISKEILMDNTQFIEMKPMDSKSMLVLSLGTGAPKHEEKYSAAEASRWGLHRWAYNNGATPLLDIFSHASSDMVDIHVSTVFQSLGCEKNYLRIQVCTRE